jgi:hypothetical protein
MRDTTGDGKADYCAIVKMSASSWEARCYRALNTEFDTVMKFDPDPPKDMADILEFYQGIMFWFRFIDDMKDYADNLTMFTAGNMSIEEAEVKPLPSQLLDGSESRLTNLDERVQITRGVHFNGMGFTETGVGDVGAEPAVDAVTVVDDAEFFILDNRFDGHFSGDLSGHDVG